MMRILAIADDLSGAAEIAGIGRRFGLSTRLSRDRAGHSEPGLTVVDTDSRLLAPEKAGRIVRESVAALDRGAFYLIDKKADSVLRGPRPAAIETLVDV